MKCFHCHESLDPLNTIFIVRPHTLNVEWNDALHHSMSMDGSYVSEYVPGGRSMNVNMDVREESMKAFHADCFVEVAGKKYVP